MSFLDYAPAPESRAILSLREQYGLFIDGEFVDGSGTPFNTISPATEKHIAEIASASDEDVDRAKFSSSRLKVVTQMTRANMLHIALMSSENRAASALGRNYPGGKPAFVEAMNAKARELGMTDTHYVDSSGLSKMNVASARDLAKLAMAAYQQPVLRQFVNHSALFAPYNALMYLFSGVPSKPYLDRSKFPELDVLRDNWETIRDEAMHLFDEGYIRAAEKNNDAGFGSFFKKGWKRFYLKWYDKPLPSAETLCPKTVALVSAIPNVKGAMFALLPGGSHLNPHRDPFAGSLRYHLGLATPNDDRCFIDVDGQRLQRRDVERMDPARRIGRRALGELDQAGQEAGQGLAAAVEIVECLDVCSSQVFDVNVVARAGAVGGWIIVAKYIERSTKSEQCFHHEWHQVLRHRPVFTNGCIGTCASCVEVAQTYRT